MEMVLSAKNTNKINGGIYRNRNIENGKQEQNIEITKKKREKGLFVLVPNVEEIRNVAHLEVEVDGIDEGAVGADVEAVDPRVRQSRPRRRRRIRR